MALASTSYFAAFDVTDGSQERDISPILSKALYYDLNLLGNINVDFASPVNDTTYRWNDDVLNTELVTCTTGSVASTGTALTVSSGHGVNIGDLLIDRAASSTEVMQVTATAATGLTVTRTYNSTVAVSIASNATLNIIRAEQEGSDIGADKTLNVNVRTNYTSRRMSYLDMIFSGCPT